MSQPYLRFLARLTELVDLVNAGDAGLPALQHLLTLGQEAIAADGMSFTEYGATGGRVLLATGSARCVLGRPVTMSDPGIAKLLAGPRTQERPVDELPAQFAAELRGHGLHRMVSARAEHGGLVMGSAEAYFADPDGPANAEQRAMVTFLASAAVRLTSQDSVEVRRRERDQDLFIAVTSHELRTPVTVIKGFADTLAEHWDSLEEDARRESVRVLRDRAGELARLVDRLLTAASHGGAATGAPACAPFDLVEALRTAVDQLPSELRAVVRVELPAVLPKASGEGSSVVTLLTELVTNAHRYSPPPARVTVTADADQQTVFFQVADRGIGIRPEHVERVFERFWQAQVGDRRQYGGVGLGLYLVRRLVERQNGWVSLRHREMGGTVAEVRLPRADVAFGEA